MSAKLIANIVRIFFYAIMAVSAVMVIWFYFGNDVPGTTGTTTEEPVITETFIIWAYILTAIAAAFSLIFPIFFFVRNPGTGKKTIFTILGIGVVVVVAFFLSSNEILNLGYNHPDNVPGTLKYAGTGLISVYLLIAIAFISIIVFEIWKFFK